MSSWYFSENNKHCKILEIQLKFSKEFVCQNLLKSHMLEIQFKKKWILPMHNT